MSRNKFVIRACHEAIAKDAGTWPDDFFHPALTADELALLRAAGKDLERSIHAARRNRDTALP